MFPLLSYWSVESQSFVLNVNDWLVRLKPLTVRLVRLPTESKP